MKIMIKWSHVTPVQHFCSGFVVIDHANLIFSFRDSKHFPKIWQNMTKVYYERFKCFIWIDDYIFAYMWKNGKQLLFQNWQWQVTFANGHLKKMYYLILRISGKYLEPRKLRTYKIYVVKTIGKYWAGVIFGHVIRIFMD